MAATVAGLQESFIFRHLTGVFAASGDKDVPGMLAELEPLLDEIVVTRNSSERSMDPGETAELAAEIFGEDRVRSAPRLDDAIEAAVALADETVAETGPGSGAVLITGSVITAGDARRLLAPDGGELPPEPKASHPLPPLVHGRGAVMSGLDIPLEGKGIRQLCGTVLIMEAIVIGLAIPVAIVREHANRGLAGGIGGGLAVCALLIGGVVGRPRMGWALWAGTVLQVLVIAAGVVVPAMYVLGVIFAALWVTGIWLARRHETPRLSPSPSPSPSLSPSPSPPPRPQPPAPALPSPAVE